MNDEHVPRSVTCAPRCSTYASRKMADRERDGNIKFPRKLMKNLILRYKEYPCLWDMNSTDYTIKSKRHDAITKLTELVQEHDSSATRVHVLRKLESMRSCVRREYKKVQESRQTATCEDDIYTPHLWYYDIFPFIYKYEQEMDFKTKEGKRAQNENVVSIMLVCILYVVYYSSICHISAFCCVLTYL